MRIAKPWWTDIAASDNRELSEEEWDAITAANTGILSGDLTPTAQYLRAGYPLHSTVRRHLVEAIEGGLAEGF